MNQIDKPSGSPQPLAQQQLLAAHEEIIKDIYPTTTYRQGLED